MGQSNIRDYGHLVWATKYRLPLLLPKIQGLVFEEIASVLTNLGCLVLEVNGMYDHVHVALRKRSRHRVDWLARDAKSHSSRLVNEHGLIKGRFAWQRGFSYTSVSPRYVGNLRVYIRRQKQRHANMSYQEEFERYCLPPGELLNQPDNGWEKFDPEIMELIQRGYNPIGWKKRGSLDLPPELLE